MPRPRFSVQALLLGVTFVGLCLVCWNAYHTWYRHNHGREFISTQLQNSIHNGDSVEHVSTRLGTEGVDVTTDSTLGSGVADMTRQMYAERPSGLLNSDQLLSFYVGNAGVTLQFRDGKLVNHDPTEHTHEGSVISLQKVLDTPVSYQMLQLLWQMGPLHGLAGLVAASALFAAILLAKRRSYSAVALKIIIALPIALGTAIVCAAAKLESVSLGCVIVGFTGPVAWSFAGWVTRVRKPSLADDSI